MTVEEDGAAVTHRDRPHPGHVAAQHSTADGCATMAAFDVQFHGGSWKEAVPRFDKRALRRDVDDGDGLACPDPGTGNSVVLDSLTSAGPAAIGRLAGHRGVHCLVPGENLNTRVLPVTPKTRMTYCV